jgi:DhnA family fructose-bisphosphate aldolase class Ia
VEGCPIPVVIAGGERADDEQRIFTLVRESLEAGGAGVSVGRNVFQHPHPRRMMKAIYQMVHKNIPVSRAREIVNSGK